jgi:hypothetical protein
MAESENNNNNVGDASPNVSLIVSEEIIETEEGTVSELPSKPVENAKLSDHELLTKRYGSYTTLSDNGRMLTSWFEQVEYIIFHNELKSTQHNNKVVLKECKENKRLLDLKYDDLNKLVNNIQTSVIFVSTLSGFLQATRIQFNIPDTIISIVSITISTYISLVLSISKYYKLDELKERLQTLREKYSHLHNKLDYRLDVLGPWNAKSLWIHQDPQKKLLEWSNVMQELTTEYDEIIETKQGLVTEFENIMDTKSRNQYHIKNRELNYNNRQKLYAWDIKEAALEKQLTTTQRRPSSIVLQHESLDNWDEEEL